MRAKDTSPLRIAVFDVDRTLLVKTTGEMQLIKFLCKKRMLPLSNFLRGFFWMVKKLPFGFKEAVLKNKAYLYGLKAKELKELLPEFFENYIYPRLSLESLKWMKKLRMKGYKIILISSTLDFILDYLAEKLGADGAVGSTMELVDGKFTGRISGIYPFYDGKVQALEKYFKNKKIDYANSYGFGDSGADIPLLSSLGYPVAVNPRRKLRVEASKKGWLIIKDQL